MARLRRGKGKTFHSSEAPGNVDRKADRKQSEKPSPASPSKTSGQQKSRRKRTLVQSEDSTDCGLVNDIHNQLPAANDDPELSKDVSKFLAGLQIKPTLSDVDEESDSFAHNKAEAKKPKKNLIKPKNDSMAATPSDPSSNSLPSSKNLPVTSSMLPQTTHWYMSLPPLPTTTSPLPSLTPAQLSTLTTRASSLLVSASSQSKSSEQSFFHTIIQSGTLSDRLSALTLLVQGSPLHNTRALEGLKAMAERGKGKGGREESLKALRCVVDWWVGGGAPERKLKYFRDQQLTHPGVTDEYVLLWYFEDWLKKYFFSILEILETLSLDPLPYIRMQTISLIFTLLREKPEQEQNLLRLLVNKLGDTSKSVCSRASYHLLQLLQSHPSMKSIVVRDITALVLRPVLSTVTSPLPSASSKHIRFNGDSTTKPKPKTDFKEINNHARYYATITFNQVVLRSDSADREVARKLIDVYFEMFREVIGEAGASEDGKGDEDVENDGKNGSHKGMDTGKGKGKLKVKGKEKKSKVEIKGAAGFTEVEDSNARLLFAILTGVNRALPFAQMDSGDTGLGKHIDTLFTITHQSTFNISIQALVLVHQIKMSLTPTVVSSSSSLPANVADRYYRTLYASLHDPRLSTSSKQAMYLNLLFKSLKSDENGERVKAMVRRFVQILVSGRVGGTEFIVGGLYLLGELFVSVPGLHDILSNPKTTSHSSYDALKRDPQFAHASSSPLYELYPLLTHYHPTISLYAKHLLAAKSLPAGASPDLSLNTLGHFLDRFVYKNPKQQNKKGESDGGSGKVKGGSVMQPAASGMDGVKIIKGIGAEMHRVNEQGWWKRRVEDVSVDQLFFHNYFSKKSEREKAKAAKVEKRKCHGGDSYEGERPEESLEGSEDIMNQDEWSDVRQGEAEEQDIENSDIGEDEVWKAMQATMPKLGSDDFMDDSDDIPSECDDDSEISDGVTVGGSSDSDDYEDTLSLAEGSDNEDLLPLDNLLAYDGSTTGTFNVEEEEWGGIRVGTDMDRKRKRGKDGTRERRKKMRSLPTFASYDDYAKVIEDGQEDNM